MTDVLDAALDSYRRQRFLEQASLAYASLSTDSDFQREIAALDNTSNDGLEPFAS
jgi:hypothetical protein